MRRLASGLGLVLVFVAACFLGVLIHLDTLPARRIVVSQLNHFLAQRIPG